MKPYNKRKVSKVTLKTHHKHKELEKKSQIKKNASIQ